MTRHCQRPASVFILTGQDFYIFYNFKIIINSVFLNMQKTYAEDYVFFFKWNSNVTKCFLHADSRFLVES